MNIHIYHQSYLIAAIIFTIVLIVLAIWMAKARVLGDFWPGLLVVAFFILIMFDGAFRKYEPNGCCCRCHHYNSTHCKKTHHNSKEKETIIVNDKVYRIVK